MTVRWKCVHVRNPRLSLTVNLYEQALPPLNAEQNKKPCKAIDVVCPVFRKKKAALTAARANIRSEATNF